MQRKIPSMASTKVDYLSEVLKQMQAKKTVKPDDAAKALAQYHKIQEQVRDLKEEIQIFKDTQSKMRAPAQQPNSKSTGQLGRKQSIPVQNGPTSPRRQSNTSLQNGLATNRSRSQQFNGSKEQTSYKPRKETSKVENGKQQTPRVDTASEQESEKDKEIARLRWQNAQIKLSLSSATPSGNTGGPTSTDPTITFLSKKVDENAAFKLAGEFKKIYEIEWKTAYHELEKHHKLNDQQISEVLGATAKEAYHFCESQAKQQYDDMLKGHAYVIDVITQPRFTSVVHKDVLTSKSKMIIDKDGYQLTRRFLKAYRKAMAHVPVQGLIEIFEGLIQRDVLSRHTAMRITPKSMRPYMSRLIEVNWLMSIQDPPLMQLWPRHGQLMNRETFQSYGKKGATVLHTVWPAILLHKDGLIAAKGYCYVK